MTSRCRRLATIRVMLRRPAGLPGTNSAQCYYRATIPNASRQCMKALGRELLALQKIYVDRIRCRWVCDICTRYSNMLIREFDPAY